MRDDELNFIPDDDSHADARNAVYRLASHLRGSFIDQVIWLDVILVDVLALYFVPNMQRRGLFKSSVLTGPGTSFSKRTHLLRQIVRNSYSDFALENSAFFPTIERITKFRNTLAHSELDLSPEFLAARHGNEIQFRYYEAGSVKVQRVTDQEMRDRLVECSVVVRQLLSLRKQIAREPA